MKLPGNHIALSRPSQKLGIIGGMGSLAGVMLARKVIQHSPAQSDQQHIEFVLHNNSKVPDRTMAILADGESPVNELMRSVKLLDDQQVDLMVMACMTSYFYKDQVSNFSNAYLIEPIEVLKEVLVTQYSGALRVGLLASTGIIKAGLFHDALKSIDVEVVTLSDRMQEDLLMKAIYQINGLKSGFVSDESREMLNECVKSLIENNVDIIIGGCSEISLESFNNEMKIPFIDMLEIIAKKIVQLCYYAEPAIEINK